MILGTAMCLLLSGRTFAMSGLEGTFEFAFDAPWRIEPEIRSDGSTHYGAIPIQLSIHDAMHCRLDDIFYALGTQPFEGAFTKVGLPDTLVSLGRIHHIEIRQITPTPRTQVLDLDDLWEIEMTVGDWMWPSDDQAPDHRVCRRWKGENPEAFREVSQTSEWHANLWFAPENPQPGETVLLEIKMLLLRDPWQHLEFPFQDNPTENSPWITLKNYVSVYLSPNPLPRFDDRWLYGDFHYHAQGTDNEGEAAYNYRGVIRAMGAMGLDFLFATEHASSSAQIVDADLPAYYDLPEIVHSQGDKVLEENVALTYGYLRDLDRQRYAFCHDLIYGDHGANREASLQGGNGWPQNYLSHKVMPQLFLGGEVDAIPELSKATIDQYNAPASLEVRFPYGDGQWFTMSSLCSPQGCDDPRSAILEPAGSSYLVHDFQGVASLEYYGREHLVYFPNVSDLQTGGETSFIESRTSKFGGATRRLDSDLLPEFERKGVVFVAHHLNGGNGTPGPNGVPWTRDHMLLKAFRSPAVLGLEFWNEDKRFYSRICSHDFCRDDGDGSHYLGAEFGFERHEKLEADSNSLFEQFVILIGSALGIDLLPDEYHNIALPTEEVRRGFISGGFIGGQFSLKPFDIPSGAWQASTHDTEHQLHQGAYDWDMLNLRGLNFEANQSLAWLPPNEPRRVFMGGGSDAHGDLSYRRAGYFLGTDDANDTAIGKPRNLVFVGDPEGPILATEIPSVPIGVGGGVTRRGPADSVSNSGTSQADDPRGAALRAGPLPLPPPVGRPIRAHTQEQIIHSLRGGRFCVTDGPAIRMAIDVNTNGVIDDADIQMGDFYKFDKTSAGGQQITLVAECLSTPEFGPINKVDFYVGVYTPRPARPSEGRVYVPFNDGVRDPDRDPGSLLGSEGYVSNGHQYSRFRNGYWLGYDSGHNLTRRPATANEYHYTASTTLDLDWYQADRGVPPDRFFVRAFVSTFGDIGSQVPARYGYANPIWLARGTPTKPPKPVGGKPGPSVSGQRTASGEVILRFEGTLQYAPGLHQPFGDVPGATSPFAVPKELANGFFRARQ